MLSKCLGREWVALAVCGVFFRAQPHIAIGSADENIELHKADVIVAEL